MYNIILAFITAFLLTFRVIPAIIYIADKKKLYDEPNHRKSHSKIIPQLGGVGIFAGLLFSIILWTPFNSLGDLQYILSAFIIIFLIGAKDDIDPIVPIKKFGAELLAALILIFKANVVITDFQGILGIHELPFIWSTLFTLFVIIAIINAFNLIDGVNGLAGSVSLLTTIILGFWFYKIDRIELAIVAFSTAGSIIAFLNYNFTPAKIFMGDTGALLLGLISVILTIKFFEINKTLTDSPYFISSSIIFAITIIILPIYDTIRVLVLRILEWKSPFHPDKKHLHHLLLDLGLSHMQVTLILISINILFILIAYFFRGLDMNLLLLIIIALLLFLTGILIFIHKRKLNKK